MVYHNIIILNQIKFVLNCKGKKFSIRYLKRNLEIGTFDIWINVMDSASVFLIDTIKGQAILPARQLQSELLRDTSNSSILSALPLVS